MSEVVDRGLESTAYLRALTWNIHIAALITRQCGTCGMG